MSDVSERVDSDTSTLSDERLAEIISGMTNLGELPHWVEILWVMREFKSLRSSTLAANRVVDDAEEATWRRLALQFDAHRIEALSMLRYAIVHIEEYSTVRDILRGPLATLKAFLAAPPLSGEKVLAQRLEALRAVQPSIAGEPVVKPLEWERLPNYGPDAEQATSILPGLYGVFIDEDSAAGAVFAEWVMDHDHFCTTYAKSLGRFNNWDEAKAAAQADFNARILSALSKDNGDGK